LKSPDGAYRPNMVNQNFGILRESEKTRKMESSLGDGKTVWRPDKHTKRFSKVDLLGQTTGGPSGKSEPAH
jgi:hypothetical protein